MTSICINILRPLLQPFIWCTPLSVSSHVNGTARQKNCALLALTKSEAKTSISTVQDWLLHTPNYHPFCVPRTSLNMRWSRPPRRGGGSLVLEAKVEVVRNSCLIFELHVRFFLSFPQHQLRIPCLCHHFSDDAAHHGRPPGRFSFLYSHLTLRSVPVSPGAVNVPPHISMRHPTRIRLGTLTQGSGDRLDAAFDFSPHVQSSRLAMALRLQMLYQTSYGLL